MTKRALAAAAVAATILTRVSGLPAQEPAPPAPVASYAGILAAVEADLGGPGASYAERLEAVWGRLKPFAAPGSPAPKERKIEALESFLGDFPEGNRHDTYARKMLAALESGGEVRAGFMLTAERQRTRTGWFELRLGYGLYGGTTTLALFTLRWERFYWQIARGSFIWPRSVWTMLGGGGGTGIGVPFHFGTSGRRELRVGLAVEIGGWWAHGVSYCEPTWIGVDRCRHPSARSGSPVLVPEAMLHLRNAVGAAFVAGLQVHIFTATHPGGYFLPPDAAFVIGFAY